MSSAPPVFNAAGAAKVAAVETGDLFSLISPAPESARCSDAPIDGEPPQPGAGGLLVPVLVTPGNASGGGKHFPPAATGEQLKEQGCAAVAGANCAYVAHFADAARRILLATGEVTSDDVIEQIGMPTGSPNAVGASMRAFAAANSLAVSGYVKSTRPSCHSAIVAVWRAKISP
jgi:hypothetical protein